MGNEESDASNQGTTDSGLAPPATPRSPTIRPARTSSSPGSKKSSSPSAAGKSKSSRSGDGSPSVKQKSSRSKLNEDDDELIMGVLSNPAASKRSEKDELLMFETDKKKIQLFIEETYHYDRQTKLTQDLTDHVCLDPMYRSYLQQIHNQNTHNQHLVQNPDRHSIKTTTKEVIDANNEISKLFSRREEQILDSISESISEDVNSEPIYENATNEHNYWKRKLNDAKKKEQQLIEQLNEIKRKKAMEGVNVNDI